MEQLQCWWLEIPWYTCHWCNLVEYSSILIHCIILCVVQYICIQITVSGELKKENSNQTGKHSLSRPWCLYLIRTGISNVRVEKLLKDVMDRLDVCFDIYSAGGLGVHFTKGLWAHNWNFVNIYITLLEKNDQARLQFCTCHNSSAVVTCADLWPDWILTIATILA